jgi:hypothetical protein
VATSLTTVGAGTITAAALVGGSIIRGGAQSSTPFTDTTDTAAAIIAAMPNPVTGQSWEFTYSNNTNAVSTLAAGSGVTLTNGVTVGPGAWATYLIIMTGASTVSMQCIAAGANFASLPPYQLSTNTTTTTFAAGQLTGAQDVTYTSTATTPGSIATRTATQMFGDVPGAFVGMQWRVRIFNNSSGANSLTLTAGSGVTLSGKRAMWPRNTDSWISCARSPRQRQ